MRMPTIAVILLASAACLPMLDITMPPAFADEAELPGAETQFLAKAIISGRNEVELSKVATQKAGQADVKQFAEQMVKDHTAANDKLMSVAEKHKIKSEGTYGTPPLEESANAKSSTQQLEALSGTRFDKAYMQRMIDDHTQAVAQFQDEAKNGKDTSIRDLASATLPTLQEHLEQARKIGMRSAP